MSEFNILEAAKSALSALNRQYYLKFQGTDGAAGDFKGNHFWERAEMLEMIEDAYEITGDPAYKEQIQEIVNAILTLTGKDWSRIPFFDDPCWGCMAFLRAAALLENPNYTDIAKNNLDYVWEHGRNLSGQLVWKVDFATANTITMAAFSAAACMLAKALGDESYYGKAISQIDFIMENLSDQDTGHIFDKYRQDGTVEEYAWDYNHALFARACGMLYAHTGNEKYLDAAEKTMAYLTTVVYPEGRMDYVQRGDGSGFKGVTARHLRWFAETYNHPKMLDVLRTNAEAAWSNRNKYGLMQNGLWNKTVDSKRFEAFDLHSAVSVMFNAIGR